MRATFEQPRERAILATRLGLSPDCNDETLAEAWAEWGQGGREWIDAERHVPDEYDEHFGEPRSHRLAAGARARRGDQLDARTGGPAPRPCGRVTFGGSGYSMLN